ncbi:MAG: S-layer homology domain-containing protein [Oscillospiraceae bacterium]|nr:S-layer homology domain-containing protein [Oscillospiraceae bacterium]
MKKEVRRLLSFVLTFGMLIALFPAIGPAAAAAWGGSDQDISWYVRDTNASMFNISDENDLAGLAALVNAGTSGTVTYDGGTGLVAGAGSTVNGSDFSGKTLILTSDLNLGSQSWTPIGNSTNAFNGTFNGCGCAVSGLNAAITDSSGIDCYAGLFGAVYINGTVENLAVSGLVSYNGTANSTDIYVGGVVARNGGLIKNCRSACTVDVACTNGCQAGGIAGQNAGSIQNCCNTGTVTTIDSGNSSNNVAGGIAGTTFRANLRNCCNTGTVATTCAGTGETNYAGGIVGRMISGSAENAYNTGAVSATLGSNIHAGAVTGSNEEGSSTANCYWLTGTAAAAVGSITAGSDVYSFDASGILSGTTTINGTSCTTLLAALNAWVGIDTNNQSYRYWTDTGSGSAAAPVFFTYWSEVAEKAASSADYSVSGNDYTVNTALGLAYAGNLITTNTATVSSITLTGDIDLSLYSWTPIGTGMQLFAGTFDGAGYQIQNMYISNSSTANNFGLFSTLGKPVGIDSSEAGTVQNLVLTEYCILGQNGSSAGGIAGAVYDGTIQNCGAFGIIDTNAIYDGGITGCLSQGSVENCWAEGSIESVNYAGGIAGEAGYNNTVDAVKNCCSTVTFSGADAEGFGSAVGRNTGSCTVTNCYYLDTSAAASKWSSGGAVSKSAAELATAEMAWILNTTNGTELNSGVWAQGTIPVFADGTHLAVYRIFLTNSSSPTAVYSAADGSVTLPTAPTSSGGGTFLGWCSDAAFSSSYTAPLILTQDATIYGRFTASGSDADVNYYAVTSAAGAGGSISPSGRASVVSGHDKTYTITADEGYEVKDVLVDGVSVGAVSAYTFENVKSAHTITAFFKKIVTNPFADVKTGNWFYDSAMFAYENGLMNGTAAYTFSPNTGMTRAMFVTVLYRMSGDDGSYTNTFSDVPSGKWYENAVAWAAKNGITSGIGNGLFAPNTEVTREQLAVMLYNYAKYKGYDVSVGEDTNILSYNDALTISDYAYSALQWACGAGVMNGDDNGNLNPQNSATRAEAAAMLQRFMENVVG